MDLSKQRRIQNEQVFKEQNQERQEMAKQLLRKGDRHVIPIKFICECSRMDCLDPIELTLEQFEKIRQTANVFVVREGHEHPDIEVVMGSQDGYSVVRKPSLSTA